jgi:hypothetical protein
MRPHGSPATDLDMSQLGLRVEESMFELFRSMARALPGAELDERPGFSLHHAFPGNPMFTGGLGAPAGCRIRSVRHRRVSRLVRGPRGPFRVLVDGARRRAVRRRRESRGERAPDLGARRAGAGRGARRPGLGSRRVRPEGLRRRARSGRRRPRGFQQRVRRIVRSAGLGRPSLGGGDEGRRHRRVAVGDGPGTAER